MTGTRLFLDDASDGPAIHSPRARQNHYRLAATITAVMAAERLGQALTDAVRGRIQRRTRPSKERRAQIRTADASGILPALRRVFSDQVEPVDAAPVTRRRIDPVVDVLFRHPEVRAKLGFVGTLEGEGDAWILAERDPVSHRVTARIVSRGARAPLAGVLESVRSAFTAIGFRVVFADVFSRPGAIGHVASIKLQPLRAVIVHGR